MKHTLNFAFLASLAILAATTAQAKVSVTLSHAESDETPAFRFSKDFSPRKNDLGAKATFTVVAGRVDPNGAGLAALNDGVVPREEDEPAANFFFASGTRSGRITADLGEVTEVASVQSYSWHPDGRAPQVYSLYGATGTNSGFDAKPSASVDPASVGWQLIAKVDTRPERKGGQHGANIKDDSGSLGNFRYLLWDVEPVSASDPFGQTFFSEIDIQGKNPAAEPESSNAVADSGKDRELFEVDGGYQFTLDTAGAPDLRPWARTNLIPMIKEWYPKLIAMLPSEGYSAPKRVSVTIKETSGVAYTSGARITCSAAWMRGELKREAVGAVFHELVHVVQQYGQARRSGRSNGPNSGWIGEAIPDYIRWYIYEPQTKGAEISAQRAARVNYNDSYRVSANFLNWVVQHHDKELLSKLNDAMRNGEYKEELWTKWTGQSLQTLGEQWKQSLVTTAAK